jgi:hypothetical protein
MLLKKILLTILLLHSNLLFGCDCPLILSSEDSKLIFQGKVMKIKRIASPLIKYEITVKITKRIKGEIKPKIIIIDTRCLLDGCCGVGFKIGCKYEIYTYFNNIYDTSNKVPFTDLCTNTKLLK